MDIDFGRALVGRLRALLRKAGISTQEVDALAGTQAEHLRRRLNHGEEAIRRLRPEDIDKILGVLKLTPDALLGPAVLADELDEKILAVLQARSRDGLTTSQAELAREIGYSRLKNRLQDMEAQGLIQELPMGWIAPPR